MNCTAACRMMSLIWAIFLPPAAEHWLLRTSRSSLRLGFEFLEPPSRGPIAERIAARGGMVRQPLCDHRQPDRVGHPYRSPPIVGEAVAGSPHHVNVARAIGDALIQDFQPLVDQRVQKTFGDLLLADVLSGRDPMLGSQLGGDGSHLRARACIQVKSSL